jgi:hypothetical protein
MSATEPSVSCCDISFKEKVKIFSHEYLKCCLFIADNPISPLYFTKLLYSRLTSSAQILEDFLDFHGAKNNQDWYLLPRVVRRHAPPQPGSLFPETYHANRLVFYELPETRHFSATGTGNPPFS